MAEIFLSAAIQVLFDKLLSPEYLINFVQREEVHASMNKWKQMLIKIQAVLSDAEEKQITNPTVKIWLDELRDLAYDVEDVLDEFATEHEALRRKLMEEPQASPSKLRNFIPTCCASFKPSAVRFNFKMESKIKHIDSRLEEILKQKDTLELRDIAGGASTRTRESRASQLTSSLPDRHIYGRDKDKEEILQLLGGEASDGGVLSVIPINGMGGVGKTTLAQLVYNDDKVTSSFDTKAWVCVSQEFDLIRVTKEMLQKFTSQPSNFNDLESLQVSLKKELSEKKFLLVLDDVWHEDYEDWTKLRRPLEAGAPGSTVIVTTRNEGVSKIVRTVRPYSLRKLSDDECLSVFAQHALGSRGFDSYPNLRQTGEKLAKRCKGLPLAAKALGGFLRTDVNLKSWEDVLNSKIWEEERGIIPALRLSYYHLPPHLKQCFAYCSILPEDYEFEEEELVRLWMATGLVQQQKQGKQILEDIGSEYFHVLLLRSFFQVSNESRYVMHDLIKDLAQWVAGETCFRLEGEKHSAISENARHSSYVGSILDGMKKFEAFNQVKKLRTFLPLKTPYYGPEFGSYLTNYVSLSLLPELRCLRVLSLRNYQITELPDSLGDLKHLRYLDFSRSRIVSLPESISTLYNLQTLILKDCSRLKKLPTAIENLINLRLLDFTNANSIKEMPPRVGKLTTLQKLSNFIVGDDNGSRISELMKLKHLRGALYISRLENVIDAREAREAGLKDKQELNGLTMEWSSEFKDSRNEEAEKELLDMLQPHKKLEEPTIKWYCGITLPTWVGDFSFSNMVLVRLENCLKCTSLPALGQLPSLKDLFIRGMNGVTTVGIEFYGKSLPKSFPLLESLCFEEMPEWKDWFPFGVDGPIEAVFSSLSKLFIGSSPKLLGLSLPSHLVSLEELIISGCQQLTVSISSLPKLRKFDIRQCQEVLYRSTEGPLSAVKSMVLSDISQFTCLTTEGFVQGLTNLEDLEIVGCGELTSLQQKEVGLLQNLTSLRRLEIRRCPKFVSLVENGEEEEEQQQQGLTCSRLESLELVKCENLEKLQGLHTLTSLRKLEISECPRLVSVLETGLTSELGIEGCNAQALLMHSRDYAFLEDLTIVECDSLTALSSRGELPASLKYLHIENCPKLESVADRLDNNTSLEDIWIFNCESLKSLPKGLHNLNHLSKFWIDGCPNLVSFPNGGCSAANLAYLYIVNCIKLDALPDFTSLKQLWIDNCPGMVCFPKDCGFLTNLTWLQIKNLKMWKSLVEWGLHRLTSLQSLVIQEGCPEMVSFPEEEKGMILPTSLTELWIENFPNLETLSYRGFQNLTSLKSLSISDCPKLQSFPEEGLPPSLLKLYIRSCPLLKQRCKKDRGRDWLKIVHIPCVLIDGRFIHDPEEEQE